VSKGGYVGRAMPRLEDPRMVCGLGQYVDDLQPAGLLHAAILRSPVAHALLKNVDVTNARALAGVHAVFTAADFPAGVPEIPLCSRC
jgi:carbon-monoxide dehydrogenase large subunit